MPSCMVKGCNKSLKCKLKKVKVHRFPVDEKLRQKWMIACGIEKIKNLQTARICSEHFTKEDYRHYDIFSQSSLHRSRLKATAVPHLLVPVDAKKSKYNKLIEKCPLPSNERSIPGDVNAIDRATISRASDDASVSGNEISALEKFYKDYAYELGDYLLTEQIETQVNRDDCVDGDDDTLLDVLCDELTDREKAECMANGRKRIQCFICSKEMTKIYQLRQHMQTHVNLEALSDEMLEASPIYSVLNPHRRNIDITLVRDFLNKEMRAKHISQFYGIFNAYGIELDISDSETDSDEDMDEDQCIPKNNYKCELCKCIFRRRYIALLHQRSVHTESSLSIQCEYCGRRFIGIQLLIHHLKTQCESDEYPTSCVTRFQKDLLRWNLKHYDCRPRTKMASQHSQPTTRTKINAQESSPSEAGNMVCPICNKTIVKAFSKHMREHSGRYFCTYCDQTFQRPNEFVNHLRKHNKAQMYTCTTCKAKFTTAEKLSAHSCTSADGKKTNRRAPKRKVVDIQETGTEEPVPTSITKSSRSAISTAGAIQPEIYMDGSSINENVIPQCISWTIDNECVEVLLL